ncbi:hypothetical protein [Hymenobacter mucosus]|uniref:HMA domain-containing protein n=1 Tax=Hymenobacter mucosus TaxID=1411120 RepID=A0A238W858_9BACT|nr:hypothetical protein [Hymenobacter mucosus]SNR42722.1 hypothetical protein SAMN06269173_102322 [Hymenobacter mucosus]
MSNPIPNLGANATQIVRYNIQLPAMQDADSLEQVRAQLMDHNLIVDRLVPGEAVVTSATGSVPDWEAIKDALKRSGYPATHTTTDDE